MIARYTRPELARLWSDDHRYDIWLRIELAACEEMEAGGSVPRGTADAVRAKAAGKLSAARILEHEERTRHDVIAFLTHVEELAGEPARWLHLGMTSSDVLDAALAVQLVEATDQILEGLDKLRAACRRRAEEERATPAIGRSHGIHAEPITAGLVFAGFYAELGRARRTLVAARKEIAVGKIAGAVGTYANLDPAIETRALAKLGLRPEVVPTQIVARDRHAAYFAALARVGTAVERLALTVRHWQRTEVGEATEAFGKGQKGSSAMPHKKNPILSENLCGLARLLRSYEHAAAENVALWHERDISHSSVERVILPDSFIALDHMLRRFTKIVGGMVVYPERMLENLGRSRGVVFSGSVLLELARRGVSREQAYEWVQRNAMRSFQEQKDFKALLAADADIARVLPRAVLDDAFDLNTQLRNVDAIFARVFSQAAVAAG